MTDDTALLRAVRRRGDEAQFTQVIAGVATAEPGFAGALAHALVAAAPHEDQVQDALGSAGVPSTLMCRAEETVRTAGGVNKGRVDLLFHTRNFDFRLLVELKLASSYGPDQVQNYLDALDGMGGPRGLLAVTTNVPGVGEPPAGRPWWFGSLRWRAILQTLRGLRLADPLGEQWRTWLDIMEADGDFGMSIDETAVKGWSTQAHTRDALCQLMEDLAPHALERLGRALAKRPAWQGVTPADAVGHVFRSAENKKSYPTKTTVQGRLRIPANGPMDRPRLIIQFLGGDPEPKFTVEARRPGFALLEGGGDFPGATKFRTAVQWLAERDPPFEHDPKDRRGYYARVYSADRWLRSSGPDAEALLEIIETDVTTLAESGILDPDSGFEADLGVTVEAEEPVEE